MKQVAYLLSMKQLTTTPYNPACNGLVERFNGTLKSMLKKMCSEQPKQWDRYIAPLLFAYREAPQESLGFSPFELLYGRTVRGPLTILKELWTNEIESDEVKTTYGYVLDLRNRLEDTLKLAQEELSKNQKRYKQYGDRKRKVRSFEAGEKVLVLLPTDKNKLLMKLKGPFEVKQKVNNFDYRVLVKGKEKIYHINLLRKYVEREGKVLPQIDDDNDLDYSIQQDDIAIERVCVAVIEEQDACMDADEEGEYNSFRDQSTRDEIVVELPKLESSETIEDIKINPDLDPSQIDELKSLAREFSDVLTDLPGTTELIEHEVKLITEDPVRSKPYPVPFSMKDTIKKEVESMLKMDIIVRIECPYASPVVLIKKTDGSNRFCIDYRKINKITVLTRNH